MKFTRSKIVVLAGTALITSTVIGVNISASDQDAAGSSEPAVPEVRFGGHQQPAGLVARPDVITTSGSSFDPTILTKSIPARAFIANEGASNNADFTDNDGSCIYAAASLLRTSIVMAAPVELPDGARIKRVTMFGQDNHTPNNISLTLFRGESRIPLIGGTPTNTSTAVTSITTEGKSGALAVSSPDNLNEVTGSFADGGVVATHINHRFHYLEASMLSWTVSLLRLCGVEVEYQVRAPSGDAGSVFHSLTGYRAYDSRLEMAPLADGPISAGESRTIPVKDGRDVATGEINLANAIPSAAVAVTYTVTAANPSRSGFLFVGPGTATEITASNVNWGDNTSGAIANSGTVELDANRQIKVFAGGPGSSTEFIIDITGYYAATEHPNMAN